VKKPTTERIDLGTVLLSGVVGSTAHGTAHADSDVDRLGVYAVDTVLLHGINPAPVAGRKATTVEKHPDVVVHEAAKFASLMLHANPSILELVWLPERLIEHRTPLGDRLIELRAGALSRKPVQDSFLGYAEQQFGRFAEDGRFKVVPYDRIAKHARHLLRVVDAGCHLWATGELLVEARSAETIREFGQRVADGDLDGAHSVLARAKATFDRVPSPLPEQPDTDALETWVQDVRKAHWEQR
jgi:hypothetical protein